MNKTKTNSVTEHCASVVLFKDTAKKEIWERHKDELVCGCLDVMINNSTSGAFWIGSFVPESIPVGTPIRIRKIITGKINGLSYEIGIWEPSNEEEDEDATKPKSD